MFALLCVVVSLVGCMGGGSQSPSMTEPETPEKAVGEIFSSWRAGNGPVFAVSSTGSITAQTTASETRFIRFRDFSGELWELMFSGVEYVSADYARVNTHYYYSGNPQYGGLKVVFLMVRDNGAWFLNGLEIVELPAVVVIPGTGIKGYLTDEISKAPIQGAVVEAFNQATSVSYGSDGTDTSGYYEISPLPAGTYYLVINREGYEPRIIRDVVVY